MALKMNFREVTPEDTEILRMIALRNGKAEDYLCCDVTNEDGVTQTTWYSKADVALWGEDYIRAHTTMKYSDYSGWIIILDMEPWNDTQASPRKKKKRDSFPQIPTWLEGHVKERKQKRLPTVTLCSSAGNELLEVWYYGELLTVKGESQSYIIDRGETPDWWQPATQRAARSSSSSTVGSMVMIICSAMNTIQPSWRIAPSSGMRSLPPSWCWNWATISTMRMKKRASR